VLVCGTTNNGSIITSTEPLCMAFVMMKLLSFVAAAKPSKRKHTAVVAVHWLPLPASGISGIDASTFRRDCATQVAAAVRMMSRQRVARFHTLILKLGTPSVMPDMHTLSLFSFRADKPAVALFSLPLGCGISDVKVFQYPRCIRCTRQCYGASNLLIVSDCSGTVFRVSCTGRQLD